MCTIQLLITIKLIGSTQCALFHLVKDLLDIYKPAPLHIKLNLYAQKLFHQQGNIKTITVVTSYIAAVKHLLEFMSGLPESRRIFHHFISDTMYIDGYLGN